MRSVSAFLIFSFVLPVIFTFVSPAAQYDPEVYRVQKALSTRGYDPGPLDGLRGRTTRNAVEQFQRDFGLPITGIADQSTKSKLGIISSERSFQLKKETKERRIALVIGNGAYQSAPLNNPVNDAKDMSEAFHRLGFEVETRTNASQEEMENAIYIFSKRLKKGGVGLFYFAGHGAQIGGRNYMVPVGANIRAEREIKYKGVDAGLVTDGMYDAGNGLNIVLLDACRDNPFSRSFRTGSRGLAQMDASTGTFIAYATAPGAVAADGPGRNGIFTKQLLKYINEPGFKIEDVLKRVRIGVMQETENKQVPWQTSSLTGDFYFIPPMDDNIATERKRLKQERLELARLKAEFEARQKLPAEREQIASIQDRQASKKTTKYASVDPAVVSAKVVDKDSRYEKYASGVVHDTKTGLEWYAGPDKNTGWKQAKSWVASLKVAGGGWRMPTRKELGALYQKGAGTRNMTPLLKTRGWYVWSGETRNSSSGWDFDFGFGTDYWLSRGHSPGGSRSFAVRARSAREPLVFDTLDTQDIVISFTPNQVKPHKNWKGYWVWQMTFSVYNPNDFPVEVVAFGNFNECLTNIDSCAYHAKEFSEWLTSCGRGKSYVPAKGTSCDKNWWIRRKKAPSIDLVGNYAIYYKDKKGNIIKTKSESLTLRKP